MTIASPLAHRPTVARLVGWSALGALPALVSGRCIELALDRGFLAGRSLVGVAWLVPLAVAGVVGAFAARRSTPLVGACVEPFRDRLVRHVIADELRRATSGPSTVGDPSAVARIVGQTDMARDISGALLARSFELAATATMAIVGLALLEPLAAVVVLAPVLLTLVVVGAVVPTLAHRMRRLLRADEALAATSATVAVATRDIVACGGQAQALSDVARMIDRRADASRAFARTGALRSAFSGIGGNLPLLLLLATAPWLIEHGGFTVGGLLGAIVYVSGSLQPAVRSATDTVTTSLVQLRVLLRNIERQVPQAPSEDRRAIVLPEPPALRATDVSFAHADGALPIVEHLDLDIAAGTHLAIVGPSGVGKSTLVDLLAGLRRPDAGRLSIGGVGFDRLPAAGLRSLVTIVPQEAYVFAGTLAGNLRYLCADASDGELADAARATGLGSIVERLGGFDAPLDPDELSEGERQLVVATRVLLSSATVVILDEGTSRLDPAAEARVEEAFRRRGGTLIVVAHRISSARRADEVMVMDGRGIERGTHDELVERSVMYADLVGHWAHHGIARISVLPGTSV